MQVSPDREVETIQVDETCGCSVLVCNIFWLILFGWESFILWMLAGVVLCLLIITIPFGIKCFKLAFFVVMPFGQTIIYEKYSVEFPFVIGNVLWLLVFGIPISLYHLMSKSI